MINYFFLLFIVIAQVCWGYQKPDTVSQELWEEVSPYFLPEDHPMKSKLDKIFGRQRVTRNTKSVLNAGFFSSKPGEYSQVIVTGHFDLPGHVIKMYLDTHEEASDGPKFKDRVQGSIAVRKWIKNFAYGDVVKTPRKWIYPLSNFDNSGPYPKHFILIAEDMKPFPKDKSLQMWKKKISKRQLDAVWVILKKTGLPDCIYAFNIPFCHDKKLAFLDTEYSGIWPVKHRRLEKYLRGEMRTYWNQLCDQKGP